MTTEHKIEIREAEFDALIKLYEACSEITIDRTFDRAAKEFLRAYSAAKKEVEKG